MVIGGVGIVLAFLVNAFRDHKDRRAISGVRKE
jgi:hypothetical protein